MSSSPTRSSPAPPEKPAPVQFNQPPQHAAQYQPMPMPMPQAMYQPYSQNNDVPRPSKTWNISKIILGSFAMVFDIVLIAMGGAMINLNQLYWWSWPLMYIIIACIAAVSLLWQVAELITICVRRNYIGIHPGAHVGIHLILWLGCCVIVGIMGAIISSDLSDYQYYVEDDGYSSYYGDITISKIRTFIRMEEAELALAVLLLICHFTLFVLACIETDKRNKAVRTPRTVYVVAPPPGHASVYYAPAPAQGMPQPYPYPPMQYAPQQPQQPQPARVNSGGPNQAMYGYYAPAVPPMQTHNGSSRQSPQPAAETSSTPVNNVPGPSGSNNTHERVNLEQV